MSTPGEIDPTTTTDRDGAGAEGGAMGGDSAGDSTLPPPLQPQEPGPTDPTDGRRRLWPGGARPKTKGSYQRVPPNEPDTTTVTTFSKEKSGGPSTSKGTAETSFIEGQPKRRVKNLDSLKIELTHQRIQEQYPEYGKEGRVFTLKVEDGKVLFVGPKGGLTNPFLADNRTFDPKFLKLKAVQKILGPTRDELIRQKEQEIQQKAQESEELNKTIEEDTRVANDENEQPSVRDQARKRITENTERVAQLEQEQNQLEQEREQLEERLPLRERVKNIFKKYGWTLQAVVLAVGLVLGALALAGLNGLKAGTQAVGRGLKTVGQKLGSLLPGLIGSIVSFIFKAAGSVLSFLGASTPGCSYLLLSPSSWKGFSRRAVNNKAYESQGANC